MEWIIIEVEVRYLKWNKKAEMKHLQHLSKCVIFVPQAIILHCELIDCILVKIWRSCSTRFAILHYVFAIADWGSQCTGYLHAFPIGHCIYPAPSSLSGQLIHQMKCLFHKKWLYIPAPSSGNGQLFHQHNVQLTSEKKLLHTYISSFQFRQYAAIGSFLINVMHNCLTLNDWINPVSS